MALTMRDNRGGGLGVWGRLRALVWLWLAWLAACGAAPADAPGAGFSLPLAADRPTFLFFYTDP